MSPDSFARDFVVYCHVCFSTYGRCAAANRAGRIESERLGDAAVLNNVPRTWGVGIEFASAFALAFAPALAFVATLPLASCASLIAAPVSKSANLGSCGWRRLVTSMAVRRTRYSGCVNSHA